MAVAEEEKNINLNIKKYLFLLSCETKIVYS